MQCFRINAIRLDLFLHIRNISVCSQCFSTAITVYPIIPAKCYSAKAENALTAFLLHGHGSCGAAVGTGAAQDASFGSQIEIGRSRGFAAKVTEAKCFKTQLTTCVDASVAPGTHIAPEAPRGFRPCSLRWKRQFHLFKGLFSFHDIKQGHRWSR